LGDWILGLQGFTELSLYRSVCGFDIDPLMVMLHEIVAVKLEVVVHLAPKSRTFGFTSRVLPEWDVCLAAFVGY